MLTLPITIDFYPEAIAPSASHCDRPVLGCKDSQIYFDTASKLFLSINRLDKSQACQIKSTVAKLGLECYVAVSEGTTKVSRKHNSGIEMGQFEL